MKLAPRPRVPRQVYINGRLIPADQATVSVFDHGLLYGDGVFEGLRSYGGKVFRLEQHVRRLYESARAIRLERHGTVTAVQALFRKVAGALPGMDTGPQSTAENVVSVDLASAKKTEATSSSMCGC